MSVFDRGEIIVSKRSERLFFRLVIGALLALGAAGNSQAREQAPVAPLQFSFGPGQTPPGYVPVKPGTIYSAERGFGFEPGADIEAVERRGEEPPAGELTSTNRPFFFSVKLPEGNYKVTLTLGDRAGESTTTVKAELRRLMLENIHTAAGQIVTRSFIVNIRTPRIPTGGEVHLKAREIAEEAWEWDDRLTLEFNGARPRLDTMQISPADVPTVFILGDSTVCDQPKEPYASWGQMLPRFFHPDIAVANYAESGESLASSTGAHRLEKVLSVMRPGDYLLIQYGHNDMKSKSPNAAQQYKATLKSWVEQVRQKGGFPVLITPMNRHTFQNGIVTNSLKEYPQMVREAAAEEGVPVIDLNAMSKVLYESLGEKPSIELFEHNADRSVFDHTHHSPYGAYELAKCVIAGIRQDHLDLAGHLSDDVPPFDPAHPDPAAGFDVPPSPQFTTKRPLGD
jgi:lysophospholipase L1-like esterase